MNIKAALHILLAMMVLAAAAIGVAAAMAVISPQQLTRVQQLIDPEDNSPTLNCQSGQDHQYTYVRCQADRYGRMLFIYVDEAGQQHVVGDAGYTRDSGILFVNGTSEIIVTFTDMDELTAWQAVPVTSRGRLCVFRNNCLRV